ncbi:pleckstrin homology domain-containing family G member 3-like [Myxocyprinus asiaticus]|uniref:pleckstrin homology domain-containing family G member 3-like n=1 Tax=Myxocyprinus asiaticus TaxID=70543 RepID=UPI002221D38B|nr:pleckstrin homology domain-containing family G member 3-like [Myxocyprinus asiaticus]
MREESGCGHDNSLMGEVECHRLSTGSSVGSHDPHSADCSSLSGTEHSEDRRPVSTVSTVSSSSSVEGNSSPCRGSPNMQADVNLELSPSEGPLDPPAMLEFDWPVVEPLINPVITVPEHCVDPSPFATVTMAPNPQLTYVDRVVMEIIETERMYVRDLCSIIEDYLVHIIDSRDLPIKPEQVCSLFGNIEHIYEFNSELLQSLDMCGNDPVAIARCFVDKSDYFDIYTQYCTNYPNSVAVLTDFLRNKTLAKFFRDRQASLKRSLPLGSYLLKPVQRVLKYHLLLQEIAKHFGPEQEGHDVVIEAIDTMTGVAWYINDMKRKHEHAVRLQEIQSLLLNWKGPDLTTYGELVLEGTFHVHRAKNERTLFLFDKMLLITKKRGEHYVYKTHISCSTLMLIESAKDSLRFSVTHYKHPKQPHAVQARTLEEKKLWAHHIKRLILENHHAVIPQKARDAILDMDSMCPVKYRYSPDRLKKATSCHSDSFSGGALKERRRSEPAKRIARTTKALIFSFHSDMKAALVQVHFRSSFAHLFSPLNVTSSDLTLQHADSEGTLLVDIERRSMPPAANISSLSTNPVNLKAIIPVIVQNGQEDLESSTGSLDDPSEKRLNGEEEVRANNSEDRLEGENAEEEVLMGVDQVADFATSVLAAITCWQCRARALLSDQITMDRDGSWVNLQNWPMNRSHQTPSEDKPEDNLSLFGQSSAGQNSSQRVSSPGVNQSLNYPETHGTIISRCHTDLEIVDLLNGGRETEEEMEDSVGFSTYIGLETQVREDEEKTPSSRDLLEGTEDMVVDEGVPAPYGLLPSSVLDNTNKVSEQFTCSLSRKSSLGAGRSCDLGYPSSRSESRRSSMLSCSTEPQEKDKAQDLGRSTPELSTETVPDSPFKPDQRPQRIQDTLTKKDRMLIHKIRCYYEHAEHQDASFAVKRRESLSYIPAGLVRNLSQQLNDLMPEEDLVLHRRASTITRPTSWDVFNLPGLDSDTKSIVNSSKFQAQNGDEVLPKAEDFQPTANMVKVWQDQEVEMIGALRQPQDSLKTTENSQMSTPDQKKKAETSKASSDNGLGEPLLMLEESDESSTLSTLSPFNSSLGKDKRQEFETFPNQDHKFYKHNKVNHAPLPKIISLRSANEENLILHEMDNMKNKVFQLARQYSQRIKNNRPVVKQRPKVSESHFMPNNLSSVMEERPPGKDKGIPDRILSLALNEQDVVQDSKTSGPSSSLCSPGSPQMPYICRLNILRPQSPAHTESFHWPDVKELRSKYNNLETELTPSYPLPVSCSSSYPERMLEHGLERSRAPHTLSCSSPFSDVTFPSPTTTDSTTSSSKTLVNEGALSPRKVSSLDRVPGAPHTHAKPNSCYDTGQATLPNDNNLIVVEGK